MGYGNNDAIFCRIAIKQKIKVYVKAVRVKYGTSEIQLVANDIDYLAQQIMEDKQITHGEAIKVLENV